MIPPETAIPNKSSFIYRSTRECWVKSKDGKGEKDHHCEHAAEKISNIQSFVS